MRRKAFLVFSTISIVFLFCTAGLAAEVDGIWFTEDAGQSLAGYIQTYTTHSILVILTPQGDDFHVFLDPDHRDGVDIAGLDNANKHLQLTFSGDSSATGTLTLPGQPQRSLILSRSFTSPDTGHVGDGIYQSPATMSSTFRPTADAVSCYLQFYTAKSMIAIFTKDLATYYVFLDNDYTDGVQVTDYIHGASNLTMTFNQDGTVGATIESGQNGSEAWTLTKSFTAPDVTNGISDCDVGPEEAQDISATLSTLYSVGGETPASALLDALSTLVQGILGGAGTCPTVTFDPPLNLLNIPSSMTITLDFVTGCTLGDLTVSGSAVIQLDNLDIDLGSLTDIGVKGDFALTINNLDIGAAEGAVNGTATGNVDITVAGDITGTQVQLSGQVNLLSSSIQQGATQLLAGGGSLVFDLDATSMDNIPFTATFTSNGLTVMGNAINGSASATGTAAASNNQLQKIAADLTFTNFGSAEVSLNGTASIDAELSDAQSTANVTTDMTITGTTGSHLTQAELTFVVLNDILTVNTSSQTTSTFGNTSLTITDMTVDLAQNCNYPTGGQIVFTCASQATTTITYQGCDTPPVVQ
ncbi:MAG: hypothetical protein HY788_13120 [Deltaproteobacteria bacterium]|nr:hypothetical protein [Deltaproteobacteria bacterium]